MTPVSFEDYVLNAALLPPPLPVELRPPFNNDAKNFVTIPYELRVGIGS
jgi:hypothetical protein